MAEIKLFGQYPSTGIKINDPGLRNYINLSPIYIPRTYGRYEHAKFNKSEMHIVERLINKLMHPGHKGKKHWRTSKICTGKAATTTKIVQQCFEIIEKQTKKNPVEVLAKAVENAALREEVTVIEVGGVRIPKQVDTAPQRRIDLALRWIVQGTFQARHGKKIPMAEALAAEIIAASNNDSKAFAISKTSENERQAGASK